MVFEEKWTPARITAVLPLQGDPGPCSVGLVAGGTQTVEWLSTLPPAGRRPRTLLLSPAGIPGALEATPSAPLLPDSRRASTCRAESCALILQKARPTDGQEARGRGRPPSVPTPSERRGPPLMSKGHRARGQHIHPHSRSVDFLKPQFPQM